MEKSVCFFILLGLTVISLVQSTDANDDELGFEKKFDKMRYYGGLGKRADSSDEENYSSDSDEEIRFLRKRLDKLRYYGSLGKRSYQRTLENLDDKDYGKFVRAYYTAKRNHRQNGIDRLRYMGNLGKK